MRLNSIIQFCPKIIKCSKSLHIEKVFCYSIHLKFFKTKCFKVVLENEELVLELLNKCRNYNSQPFA